MRIGDWSTNMSEMGKVQIHVSIFEKKTDFELTKTNTYQLRIQKVNLYFIGSN